MLVGDIPGMEHSINDSPQPATRSEEVTGFVTPEKAAKVVALLGGALIGFVLIFGTVFLLDWWHKPAVYSGPLKRGDSVEVVKGFYRGQVGTLKETTWDNKMVVVVPEIEGREGYFDRIEVREWQVKKLETKE